MDRAANWMLGNRVKKEMESLSKDFDSIASGVSSAVSGFFSSVTGRIQQPQKPLSELLGKFHLPSGIFPNNIKRYDFKELYEDGSGELTVYLPGVLEVKFPDGTMLRYDEQVTANLSEEEMELVEGVKIQGIFWAAVTAFRMESKKLVIQSQSSKKSKNPQAFDQPKEGIETTKF
eukprot:TRINITY_DN1040_c0_g1_i2.p1 TRINITY_DN1040_c0_g1~~TRINITY_DN1040_c0_g1_i2.p1  ORF type:complete len:175 (+),score=43.69 TRINITY_DN1040_c0_g1_i2:189-713(+)